MPMFGLQILKLQYSTIVDCNRIQSADCSFCGRVVGTVFKLISLGILHVGESSAVVSMGTFLITLMSQAYAWHVKGPLRDAVLEKEMERNICQKKVNIKKLTIERKS